MAATAFVACEGAEGVKEIVLQSGGQPQIVFADDAQGSSGVSFTTTGPWSSSIIEATSTRAAAPDWISISPDSGKEAGEYTVYITLDVNTTGTDRTAVITISCSGTEISITVTQKGTKEDGTVPDDPDDGDDPDTTGWVKKINGYEVVYGDTQHGVANVVKYGSGSYTNKIISATQWEYIQIEGSTCRFEYVNNRVSKTTIANRFVSEFEWSGNALSRIRAHEGKINTGVVQTNFIYGTTEYRLGNIDINWLLGAEEYDTATPVSAIGVRTSGDNYKLLTSKVQQAVGSTPEETPKYDLITTYRYEFNDDGYIVKIYRSSIQGGESNGYEGLAYTFEY
jgi:hypothetical protein